MKKKERRPEKKILPRDGKMVISFKRPVQRKSFGRRG